MIKNKNKLIEYKENTNKIHNFNKLCENIKKIIKEKEKKEVNDYFVDVSRVKIKEKISLFVLIECKETIIYKKENKNLIKLNIDEIIDFKNYLKNLNIR